MASYPTFLFKDFLKVIFYAVLKSILEWSVKEHFILFLFYAL